MTLATAPAARPVPMLKGKPIIGNSGEFGKDSLGMMDRVWKERGDIFGLRLGPRPARCSSGGRICPISAR